MRTLIAFFAGAVLLASCSSHHALRTPDVYGVYHCTLAKGCDHPAGLKSPFEPNPIKTCKTLHPENQGDYDHCVDWMVRANEILSVRAW